MITQLPEPAGIVLDFDDSGSAIVDHACEGPIPSLEQGQTIYTADQMRAYGAAEYKRDAMQAEIDELRAENAAQRKVLEQALEALENHAGNYKLNDVQCDHQNAAITAIQGVLK